jgi:urocanate hydratase
VFAAGCGWAEHGRTLGAAAVGIGQPELVLMDEVSDHADIATAPAIGAPAGAPEWQMIGVADWPLLDATAMCSWQADLVAIHSGTTSAGVTAIADGMHVGEERRNQSMTWDTSLGVMRCADAGSPESFEEIESKGLCHFHLRRAPPRTKGVSQSCVVRTIPCAAT